MSDLQIIVTLLVFAGVILTIAFNLLDMTLAALLGVSILFFFGAFTTQEFLHAAQTAGGAISLLFGGMIVARTLTPTGIFELIGSRFLKATGGSGKRFLLGLILLVAPVCAFLPNATVVILMAPIIIQVSKALDVDFIGPLILTAIISNSAGLLTLVGDPATFLVGSSIGMTFSQYLARVSLGGLMSVLALIPIMPWVMRDIWNVRRTLPERMPDTKLDRPMFCILALIVLITMILLFLFGENLPFQILPPSVAIIAASLALLVIYCTRVEPLVQVIRDVDWSTLIFISCMFLMVEAFTRTGILYSLSRNMSTWFGTNLLLIAMIMLFGVGIVSSLLANIPVVAAMILVVKGYLVAAEFVPEIALGPSFMDWPTLTIPVFVAMMFGGTLGGNATLIGASANIVSAGISASHGRPISFVMFARYGIPITFCQLFLSALYVLVLHAVIGM